jgi:DNA invertase Pin-like site-specific DNA recombinase
MTATLVGYARCSTDRQDLTAQRQALQDLGVQPDRIYMDKGLTGTNRARPGLGQAMAAVRAGDTLVVPKLDRLARSVPDARHLAAQLEAKGVKLALCRVRGGSDSHADARVHGHCACKGKLRGKQPKLSDKQHRELCRMHATGAYSIGDLAEVFAVSRPTIYRALVRVRASA